MGQPVVHFEIIGKDPGWLRQYYEKLFEWEFDTTGPVVSAVSEAGNYGFVDPGRAAHGAGIPGGVGGGPGYESRVLFYVGVPDVEAALQRAEQLGGKRLMGPEQSPGRDLIVGQFSDPDGHVIGLANAI